MKEIWKPILDRPNYLVSNLGQVKGPKKILTPKMSNTGYLLVCLSLRGSTHKNETRYVHRLIAEAFIPNSDIHRIYVNHKDRNKLNNSINNLEWVTPSENVLHWQSYLNEQDIERLCKRILILDLEKREALKHVIKRTLGL